MGKFCILYNDARTHIFFAEIYSSKYLFISVVQKQHNRYISDPKTVSLAIAEAFYMQYLITYNIDDRMALKKL